MDLLGPGILKVMSWGSFNRRGGEGPEEVLIEVALRVNQKNWTPSHVQSLLTYCSE